MKIKVKISRRPMKKREQELLRANLALLEMFATIDTMFSEYEDSLSREKRQMSLGRCYEAWKRCRSILDPEFNAKRHDKRMAFGAKPRSEFNQ